MNTDLSDIRKYLQDIAGNLHKPFSEMDAERRHRELLEAQNKRHKEMLDSQNAFNAKLFAEQKNLVRWTAFLAIATLGLCIFTAYNVSLQSALYSPKITAQITDENSPFGYSYYGSEYAYNVGAKYWNDSVYFAPVYVEITNNGIVPFQVYNIEFDGNCGNGNLGLLTFPSNLSKSIGVGETMSFTDAIYFDFNKTVQEGLPCEINFVIYGNNLVVNKKMILNKLNLKAN